jgi:hypothetical protein
MGDPAADDVVLTYTPTNTDFSTHVARGMGRSYPTHFFSVFGKHDFLVHGNSSITVTQNGRDVTDKSKTWRRMRIWALTGDSGFNASRPPDFDWMDDNLSETANWLDIPAYGTIHPPEHWTTERKMLEFAVGVVGHLDSGILYFYVIVSLKKGQHRVEMSSAKMIEYEDWLPLKKSQQPQPSGCTILIDSTWLVAKVP